MKKIAVILSLAFSLLAFTNIPHTYSAQYASTNQKADSVYICNSSTAYAYHKSQYCSGLNRCTHGVLKVSLYDAVHKYGRQPCKICER